MNTTLKPDPHCPPRNPELGTREWAIDYARNYWKHGQEPETQQALAILVGAGLPMPPAVLCAHDQPVQFAATWDELMDELGEWRRGERTVAR